MKQPPCEAAFERLAKESPAELARWIDSGKLDPADLTFAAEILGNCDDSALVVKTLLPLLRHNDDAVREGAVYGISRHADGPTKRELEAIRWHDPSPAVRSAASDANEQRRPIVKWGREELIKLLRKLPVPDDDKIWLAIAKQAAHRLRALPDEVIAERIRGLSYRELLGLLGGPENGTPTGLADSVRRFALSQEGEFSTEDVIKALPAFPPESVRSTIARIINMERLMERVAHGKYRLVRVAT